jgi:HPt (histidine-containing phosphotransfer) domain-containing protein
MIGSCLMAEADDNSGSGAPSRELDLDAALSRVGGQLDLLKELAALFIDDYPNDLNQIRASLKARDAKQLERSAHRLKGSVANFGAPGLWALAAEIERKGKTEDWFGVPELVSQLEERLERMKQELLGL